MRVKAFLLITFWGLMFSADAQKKGLKFQSLIQAGLLEGEQGSALQLQMVLGVNYKTWSVGGGAGLDYYYGRSIPLFIDVRKALSGKGNTPFLYADGGYSFSWLREKDKIGFESDSKGGLYFDTGLGYELQAFKTQQLFFSVGFSQKNFTKTYNSMPYLSIWPPPPQAYQTNEYVARRLSIKTGLRF